MSTGDPVRFCEACQTWHYINAPCPRRNIPRGWLCIRCGKVNAPWKTSCDCKPKSYPGSTSNFEITINGSIVQE